MKWVINRKVLDITGHTNLDALDKWVRRYNLRNPGSKIQRRRGFTEMESLVAALTREGGK